MIQFKPHTVSVLSASTTLDEKKIALTPSYSSGVSVECMVQPKDRGTIYTRYGVDLDQPYELYCEVADSALFETGNRVSWNGAMLVVAAEPKVYDMGLEADHAVILLSGLQHA